MLKICIVFLVTIYGRKWCKMRASVVLLDKNSQFIVLIKRVKLGRTYYVLPGGTVESGESFQQAAIREIKEELNISLSDTMLKSSQTCEDGYVFLAQTDVEVSPLQIFGEELGRVSQDNHYQPLWLSLSKAKNMTFYPEIDLEGFLEV